jgi:hypothetical protein
MSLALTSIQKFYLDAFQQLGGKRPLPEIEVSFYKYTGLKHTIRVRQGKVYVRLSDLVENMPTEVHRALARILVAKLLKKRVIAIDEQIYQNFIAQEHLQDSIKNVRRERGRKIVSSSSGHVYDLEKLFNRLNHRYFRDSLPKPTLSWSQKKTNRLLGHHDSVHETIVVSKTLDDSNVPEYVVEFVLYHEMLHIKHPTQINNGRRNYHTAAFRRDEKRFVYYKQAQEFIENYLRRIRHKTRKKAA